MPMDMGIGNAEKRGSRLERPTISIHCHPAREVAPLPLGVCHCFKTTRFDIRDQRV